MIENSQKNFDVAFCAVRKIDCRRKVIFDQLINKGLKVINVIGFHEDRDKKIAEAKILVNIHYDCDYQIYEHLRCDRWSLSGLLVITEESLSDRLLDTKDLIIVRKYDNLVKTICQTLKNYQKHYNSYKKKLGLLKHKIINERNKCFDQVWEKIGH